MAEQGNEWADRWFGLAEMILYGVVAVILVAGAAVVLVDTARTFVEDLGDDVSAAATALLAELLLVFVFVELLGAVRTTLRERQLIAEPFLLVGIIASIKEIVVLSVKAADAIGGGASFSDQLWQIGVLSGVVALLGVTAWLLRRKEREPDEGTRAK
jgi:uncharacterized membrane protein (DUF373 family)